MAEPKKSYYAIIPANVRYDENLIQGAKLLYGEITALCNEKGYCWATDSYFSSLYKVSKKTIQHWLKSLNDNGYISKDIKYKEGTNQIEHRYIRICPYPMDKKVHTPREEKVRDNNTSLNTTFNNTNNIKTVSGKPDTIPYKEIIDYLNSKANKSFKNVESNKKLIRARFNDGYTLENFKKVIDVKTLEWLNDGKMADYLRPTTLFGNKFDQYLNQKPKRAKTAGVVPSWMKKPSQTKPLPSLAKVNEDMQATIAKKMAELNNLGKANARKAE